MKRAGRVCLLLALALFLLGGALMGVGAALGGDWQVSYILLGHPVEVRPLNLRAPEPAGLFELGSDHGEAVAEEAGLEPFARLEVDVPLGDVTVKSGEEYGLRLVTGEEEWYELKYSCEDGGLTVWGTDLRGWAGQKDGWAVEVTLPAGAELEEANLHTDLGDVSWQAEGSFRALELSTDLGDVVVKAEAVSENAQVSTDLGDVKVNGLVAGDLVARSDLGDVRLNLSGADGVDYELTTGLGEVRVNGKDRGRSASGRSPGAGMRVEAHSGLGDVRLTFEE